MRSRDTEVAIDVQIQNDRCGLVRWLGPARRLPPPLYRLPSMQVSSSPFVSLLVALSCIQQQSSAFACLRSRRKKSSADTGHIPAPLYVSTRSYVGFVRPLSTLSLGLEPRCVGSMARPDIRSYDVPSAIPSNAIRCRSPAPGFAAWQKLWWALTVQLHSRCDARLPCGERLFRLTACSASPRCQCHGVLVTMGGSGTWCRRMLELRKGSHTYAWDRWLHCVSLLRQFGMRGGQDYSDSRFAL